MSATIQTKSNYNRGFLRSNGVEVSVFAMMTGLGVATFLALSILGGDTQTAAVESEEAPRRREFVVPTNDSEPSLSIGGAGVGADEAPASESSN